MATRIRLSDAKYREAMNTRTARKAYRRRAEQTAARARSLARAEDVSTDIEVTEGTRPGGRPYARVSSSNVGAEFGDSKTARRRLLGRSR